MDNETDHETTDQPVTWWFDKEISHLEKLRNELEAFSEAVKKNGGSVGCPKTRHCHVEAVFPNGGIIEIFILESRKGKREVKFASYLKDGDKPSVWHNTWRQALRRALN